MGLGNGNPKQGNRGSNHNAEHRTLLSLGNITAFLAGGATEATLQLVLAAINAGSEFEARLVEDAAGATWLEVRTWDTTLGTWNPVVYYPPNSNTPGAPTLPVTYINNSTVLATIAADMGTLSTPVTGLSPVLARRTDATGSPIAAGQRRVSFFNAGNANGTVLGVTLAAGESITFSAEGLRDTLDALSYDGTGTTLVITTVG